MLKSVKGNRLVMLNLDVRFRFNAVSEVICLNGSGSKHIYRNSTGGNVFNLHSSKVNCPAAYVKTVSRSPGLR